MARYAGERRSDYPDPALGKSGGSTKRPTYIPHIEPFERERVEKQAEYRVEELAAVLSHYDLGVIRSIRKYPRGSRRSPKVKIVADRGEFLLKRRAPGRDDEKRVEFTHRIQHHLHERGFPVPRLLSTQQNGGSVLRFEGSVYELFEYVRGRRFDLSPDEAIQSGIALGHFHRLMAGKMIGPIPLGPGYHGNAEKVDHAITRIPTAIARISASSIQPDVPPICDALRGRYRQVMQVVMDSDFPVWPMVINHGDWHPGNLLYRDRAVVAVLDFDTARNEPRVADVANTLLQFSMSLKSNQESSGKLDRALIEGVLKGYDSAAQSPLSSSEQHILPSLMIEALIMECVIPIAETGKFGKIPGFSFLLTVKRTVEWITDALKL